MGLMALVIEPGDTFVTGAMAGSTNCSRQKLRDAVGHFIAQRDVSTGCEKSEKFFREHDDA